MTRRRRCVSAQALRRQLDGSALLVAVGEQHTSFGVGNECADRVVTRYLVDRTLPGAGHTLLSASLRLSSGSFQICSAGHRRAQRRSHP